MKITPPIWTRSSEVDELFAAIPQSHENLRFVGGCVRDHLAGVPIKDIDIASVLPPEELKKYAKEAGLKTIDTGIEHGTITVVVNHKPFEITTLRRDLETDGRRAKVAYTTCWQEDASRRDFTFNALYLSRSGEVYDYFSGVADLKAGIVRFIGDAGQRITEDYLRILRFFRFWMRFGKDMPDEVTCQSLTLYAGGLGGISGERLHDECWQIFSHPKCFKALKLMEQTRVLQAVFRLESLTQPLCMFLKSLDDFGHAPSPIPIMVYLSNCDSSKLAHNCDRFKCSKKERNLTLNYLHALERYELEADLNFVLYYYGSELAQFWAIDKNLFTLSLKAQMESWNKPTFPLSGQDLHTLGIESGPQMGAFLNILEKVWIETNFRLSKETLLEIMRVALKEAN